MDTKGEEPLCKDANKSSVGHRRPIVKSKVDFNENQTAVAYPFWGEYGSVFQPVNYTYSTPSQLDTHKMLGSLPLPSATLVRHRAPAPRVTSTCIQQSTEGWNSPSLPKSSEPITNGSYGLGEASTMPTDYTVSPTAGLSTRNDCQSDSDSDSSDGLTHPNKFPVEIEYHDNQHCVYRRQNTRSGPKVKQRRSTVYHPNGSPLMGMEVQQVKYYQKDLVRICRCGKYSQMDGALVQGRANDCDGYEIHYSQKCKWKAYDDYKTGKRVLIRLCKCYKPML